MLSRLESYEDNGRNAIHSAIKDAICRSNWSSKWKRWMILPLLIFWMRKCQAGAEKLLRLFLHPHWMVKLQLLRVTIIASWKRCQKFGKTTPNGSQRIKYNSKGPWNISNCPRSRLFWITFRFVCANYFPAEKIAFSDQTRPTRAFFQLFWPEFPIQLEVDQNHSRPLAPRPFMSTTAAFRHLGKIRK